MLKFGKWAPHALLPLLCVAIACSDPPPQVGEFVEVSAGGDFTCARRANGAVLCFGPNSCWESGDCWELYGPSDVDLAQPDVALVAIGSAGEHACGIEEGGRVRCWGNNGSGRADQPNGEFTAVTGGSFSSCGLKSDQTVVCWGLVERVNHVPAPTTESFVQIDGGAIHYCGVTTAGAAMCWGGQDSSEQPPGGVFLQVSASRFGEHSCGVMTDGSVTCWGDNSDGEATPPAGAFQQVGCGSGFSCGLAMDGTIDCWGSNESSRATPPAGVFTTMTVGGAHGCGLKEDGTLQCWGDTAVPAG